MAKKNRPEESTEPRLWGSDWKKIIGALLAYKVAFFLLVYLFIAMLPQMFDGKAFQINYQYPKGVQPTDITRLATWDGQHYLNLSHEGWKKEEASAAFYPTVPFIMKAGAPLFGGNHIISGIVLLNIISVFGLYFLFQFIRTFFDEPTAEGALVLLLAFPGSMFYSFIYSEAPFILSTSLFFWFLFKGNYKWSALFAFLLPLNRAVGILISVPMAWKIYSDWKAGKAKQTDFLWCLAPLVGWAVYFLIIYLYTGNPFEGMAALKFYGHQGGMALAFDIPAFIEETFKVQAIHGYMGSLIDRLWIVPAIIGLALLWKKNRTLFFYALPMTMIPVMTTKYASFTRYLIVVFPLFILYGEWLMKRCPQYLKWSIIAALFGMQCLFTIRYVNSMWAG